MIYFVPIQACFSNNIPEDEVGVLRSGRQTRPIFVERKGRNGFFVAIKSGDDRGARGIPQTDGPISITDRKGVEYWRLHDAGDLFPMTSFVPHCDLDTK